MDRTEWNNKFVAKLMTISQASRKTCEMEAQESTTYFEEEYDPEDAAEEAYSYWDS